MKKSTKVLLTVVMVVLLVLVGINSASAAQHVSILEIRKEAEAGWQKDYVTRDRTIKVDVDIEVPEVSRVPIVSAGTWTGIQHMSSANEVINDDPPTGIFVWLENPELSTSITPKGVYIGHLIMEDGQAEDNPLTIDGAEQLSLKLFAQFFSQTNAVDLRLYSALAFSKAYADNAERGSTDMDLDFSRPFSKIGRYDLYFYQYIEDIPFLQSGDTFTNFTSYDKKNGKPRPMGSFRTEILSSDSYVLTYYPVKVNSIMIDDVPLLSLAEIMPVFEDYITRGLVRDVYAVKFGYMAFDDPDSGEYILKPIWFMSCAYQENENSMSAAISEQQRKIQAAMSSDGIAVDAQTGEGYFLYETPRKQTTLPAGNIVLWEGKR